MADNEVKIHIPSGWFSLLLFELDRNKSMISKILAHDSDHDDNYFEILRRMEARDERVKAAPDTDISMISNGTASILYYDKLFSSGLDRLNISVHGWNEKYFLQNTLSNERLWKRFRDNLLTLLNENRISKLNYVIKKGVNEDDLFQLICDLSSRENVRLDILNYLMMPNCRTGEEWYYTESRET